MSHYKPDPNKSVNLTIDGRPVTVPEGTTILDAARKVKIEIPNLCNYTGLGKRAVCRLCVVECDGRGKLLPACANTVWEGVRVVTNNLRLLNIRKTIIELLLTNHPPECLGCIKNKKCELQTMAADFGILKIPFRRDAADRRKPKLDGGTLVRNMTKCVKCGRCVEVCQEVQTVRAINSSHRSFGYEITTPYEQSLSEGPCIHCGQCATVCPVGAIYEHEQNNEVRAALNKPDQQVVIQFSPSVVMAVNSEMGLPPGTITSGKLVTALKWMGFNKVLDAGAGAGITIREEKRELLERIRKGQKLPMITSCSNGFFNFVDKFYPDLRDHLPSGRKSPQLNFGSLVKARHAASGGTNADISKITTVSVMPCISNKYETWQGEKKPGSPRDLDFALTVAELVLLINEAGVNMRGLEESPFDTLSGTAETPDSSSGASSAGLEAVVETVYGSYTGKTPALPAYREVFENQGIREAEVDLNGTKVKVLSITGLANARILLEAVRKGECKAAFAEIKVCSGCYGLACMSSLK